MKTKFKPGLYWLIHHGQLLENTNEPISARRAYVKQSKAKNEIATRLRWMRPVQRPELLPKSVQKAFSDRQKSFSDRQKADADWQKADADWQKARADWQKAHADRQKADADRQKAHADWQKVFSDWQKAFSDWQKAINGNWENIVKRHKAECPGCPFDYKKRTLIFPIP